MSKGFDKPLALVIEDDSRLAYIFSEAIEGAGFAVEVIQDGQEAIDRVEKLDPLVVVLDLHLPHVSGENILRHIRSIDALEDIQVILATADANLADSLMTMADLVLLKPISFGQLKNLAKRLYPTSE